MPTSLTWTDIAVRLALTAAAGSLFGINRSEKGRSAGLRTTLLVSLAASIAMILANRITIPGDPFAFHWAFSPAWDSLAQARSCGVRI